MKKTRSRKSRDTVPLIYAKVSDKLRQMKPEIAVKLKTIEFCSTRHADISNALFSRSFMGKMQKCRFDTKKEGGTGCQVIKNKLLKFSVIFS